MEALREGRGAPERPPARGRVSMGGLVGAGPYLQNRFPLQRGEREDSERELETGRGAGCVFPNVCVLSGTRVRYVHP